MLTMRPQPRLAMPAATARLLRNTPVRLMSITCFQASTGYWTTVALGPVMPALATRMSGALSSFSVVASAALSDASLVTSTSTAIASPKAAADCLARSRSRSHKAMRPPPAAIFAAQAKPMPRAPPVTTAVRPLNRPSAMVSSQILELSGDSHHTGPSFRPLHSVFTSSGSFMSTSTPASIDATADLLKGGDYIADRSLATVLYLALKLGRPLFCEGEAGVGKTEIAKVLAQTLKRPLIRLQCYEGLDVSSAVYEWNYARQMIEIRLAEAQGVQDRGELAADIFDERFLIRRPLLEALQPHVGGAPVLLIDELDRTDEPFEAYLLEVLSDFQITIPELGTVKAAETPIVIITSNRTREIHDALKRRCFYHWVDYPSAQRELEILAVKAPAAGEALSREVVGFVQGLRKLDLFKSPGVAEDRKSTRLNSS